MSFQNVHSLYYQYPSHLFLLQYKAIYLQKNKVFNVPKTQQTQPLISESPKLFLWLYFQKPDLFVHYHLSI